MILKEKVLINPFPIHEVENFKIINMKTIIIYILSYRLHSDQLHTIYALGKYLYFKFIFKLDIFYNNNF